MARKHEGSGAVVISGTSSGIGAATAAHLARCGFTVFAGVRHVNAGANVVQPAPGSIVPLHMDITDATSIAQAVEVVASAVGKDGIAGLVNNAGIVKPAPIEFQPLADFREQLEVNLIAHVAVIQAFLPLIRRGRGRIVNVGSIGGHITLPIHGAYSASKFGLEALSDALRLELRQWRIPVSHVDPGATDTAIFGKTLAELDTLESTLGERGYHLYQGQIEAMREVVEKTSADPAPASDLATTIGRALTSDKPKARYLAGKGAKETAAFARVSTDRIKDLAILKETKLPQPD